MTIARNVMGACVCVCVLRLLVEWHQNGCWSWIAAPHFLDTWYPRCELWRAKINYRKCCTFASIEPYRQTGRQVLCTLQTSKIVFIVNGHQLGSFVRLIDCVYISVRNLIGSHAQHQHPAATDYGNQKTKNDERFTRCDKSYASYTADTCATIEIYLFLIFLFNIFPFFFSASFALHFAFLHHFVDIVVVSLSEGDSNLINSFFFFFFSTIPSCFMLPYISLYNMP